MDAFAMVMASLSDVATRLNEPMQDSDSVWEIGFCNQGSVEAYFQHVFSGWEPNTDDELVLNKFHRLQPPVLMSNYYNESLFNQYVATFTETAKVTYNEWKTNFCKLHKQPPRRCLSRAYFSFLTMLPHEYEREIGWLVLKKQMLVTKMFEVSGGAGRPVRRDIVNKISDYVWQYGVEAGFRYVTTVVKDVLSFGVEDLFQVIDHGGLKAEEVEAILNKVHDSLNITHEYVRWVTKNVVQPNVMEVMQKTNPCNIRVRCKSTNTTEAMLCKYCNAFFLESEDFSAQICCNNGKLTRFKLGAVPAGILQEIELRRHHSENPYFNPLTSMWDMRDERMSTLARPINNYLSFATMHTTGFSAQMHKAVNLNSGIRDYMFRICGQTTSSIPGSIHNTLNAYVTDGISCHLPSDLSNLPHFIESIRETLVRYNPLAKAFRQWDCKQFENFNITIQGFEKGNQPKELGLLMHRPNVMCQMRTMDIRLTTDHKQHSRRTEPINLRYDDARVEPFQYPMLHFGGELGWGLSTRMAYDGKNNCSMRKYLRYRFMAGDEIEVSGGVDDESTQAPQEQLGMSIEKIEAHTNLPEIVRVLGSEPLKVKSWLEGNNDFCYDNVVISTSRFHKLGLLGQQYLVDGYSRAIEFAAAYEKYRQMKFKQDQDSFYLSSSFFGSPRFLKERRDNSLHLVNTKGMPLFFITVTCSENWPEFRRVLTLGQKASDSPVWVARVFNAKLNSFLERLRNGSLFYNCTEENKFLFSLRGGLGETGFCIHVIEFQLRGMPHAHICFRPWNGAIFDELIEHNDLEFVDKVATAQVACILAVCVHLYCLVRKLFT